MAFSVTVRSNKIGQLQGDIRDKAEGAVRDTANEMRDYARIIAPVLTGAFRSSLYINGPNGESDYGTAAAEAAAANPKAVIVPEQQAAQVDINVHQLRDTEGRFSLPQAIVASAVEYSLFLEEGTVHMAPRPTLRPAALVAEAFFRNAMTKITDGY